MSNNFKYDVDRVIWNRLNENFKEISSLLERFADDDMPYRFYHHSFKVERVNSLLEDAMELFNKITAGDFVINPDFMKIYNDGLVGPFKMEHNKDWLKYNRPRMEAFFHIKNILELFVKFVNDPSDINESFPSGWGVVLYLFNTR